MNRKRWIIAGGGLAVAWAAYAIGGNLAARLVAGRVGDKLVRAGDGKVVDPALFVRERVFEMLCLLTLAALLAGSLVLLNRWISQRHSDPVRAFILAGTGFVWANFWVGAAMRTGLFWGFLWTGTGNNLIQFHFKKALANENHASRRAILMGSSQTRAQMDEVLLNKLIGGQMWTTELHFPGSKAVDLWMTWRRVEALRPAYVLLYVSEDTFSGEASPATQSFISWRDLPQLGRLGVLGAVSGKDLGYGLLGDALPLFRGREAFSQRLLGDALVNLKQSRYDASLSVDLVQRAETIAQAHRGRELSTMQMRAFESFVREVSSSGSRLVVFEGRLNPLLGSLENPALRQSMKDLLKRLARDYSRIRVIDESQMPRQTSEDYVDLTHVNAAAQERFTRFVAVLARNELLAQEARK